MKKLYVNNPQIEIEVPAGQNKKKEDELKLQEENGKWKIVHNQKNCPIDRSAGKLMHIKFLGKKNDCVNQSAVLKFELTQNQYTFNDVKGNKYPGIQIVKIDADKFNLSTEIKDTKKELWMTFSNVGDDHETCTVKFYFSVIKSFRSKDIIRNMYLASEGKDIKVDPEISVGRPGTTPPLEG